ncbi:dTDP-4-dehydrorhamnose 3,5-epimerase [Pseudomonas sp. NPDC087804]|uniref:dTDP-4-dehydrorhamnose 3,5-epimerase n=1 Tax=Pseudomonas sp. NPDC087804 TaxID=3364449 RepID=UPI0038093C8F
MKTTPLTIPEVILFEPKIFGDAAGCEIQFVQDNHSRSVKRVLRGLHYQTQQPQGKLVRVTAGEVFDVAVDLCKSSPTFGERVDAYLSAENKHQLWIPEGVAHGFVVLSSSAEFSYKTTDYYAPSYERSLAWNDPAIGIDWPIEGAPTMSVKDQAAALLEYAEVFA